DLTDMRPPVATMHAGRQHQPVQLHHAANALAVVPDPERSVHHGPYPAVAVRRSAVRHRADLLHHGLVVRAAVAASRARSPDVVGGAPSEPEYRADRRHRMRRHRPDSLRNDVFFPRPPGRRAGSRPPWSCARAPARVPESWRTPPATGWQG